MRHLLALFCLMACTLSCMSLTVEQHFTEAQLLSFLETANFKESDTASCAVCTILVGMSEQYADLHSVSIDDFIMNQFCTLFPDEIKAACTYVIKIAGPSIIHALTVTKSGDQVCRMTGACKESSKCTLWTNMNKTTVTLSPDWSRYVEQDVFAPFATVEGTNPLIELLKYLKKIGDTKVPLMDNDGDHYTATMALARGTHWRGRDCNDLDAKIHPGRGVDPYPGKAVDYNCNGISGKDPQTGKDWKEVLCADTNELGVVVIGDSAGIFAQIPNEFATAADWNKTTFSNIIPTWMDQGGHPQFSAYTGYTDEGYHGTVHSVYKYLLEKNRCNFRDYQNLAVSGAASGGTYDNAQLLSRNQTTDKPLLIIMELAANDVCFGSGTAPEDFRKNILRILNWLDTVVPPGSHLVSLGTVNGTVIHEIMGEKTHPMGMKFNDFYDYLNCVGIDLCENYLTSNLTHILETAAKAEALNQVYREIFSNYTAKNYDFVHYEFPTEIIINNWKSMGGDPFDLISHVDGFHPSQNFNMLLGDYLWQNIMRDHPEWVDKVNPNNDRIKQLFGDQGGY